MKNSITKKDYEEWLNEVPVPHCDRKSYGGRIPDDAKYGTWLRHNDSIGFNVGFWDWSREEFRKAGIGRATT